MAKELKAEEGCVNNRDSVYITYMASVKCPQVVWAAVHTAENLSQP